MELIQELEFNFFPNPSNGKFNIKGLNLPPESVAIYNVLGEMVWQKQSTEIDISNAPKGIYFLTITSNNVAQTKKIILQ